MTFEKYKLKRNGNNSALAPELREFIDRAVVPNLIREYLRVEKESRDRQNTLAPRPVSEVDFAPISRPSVEGAP